MPVTAIVGANWGDEGKGRMVDALAGECDLVVRYQGGNNAGHTVINDRGKFVLHLLPAGVFHAGVTNVLGPGVAVNVRQFVAEIAHLATRGVPQPRLVVSDRAQVVLPHHSDLDRLEEERLGDAQYGSTRCGIAPFYADKYTKVGVQICELQNLTALAARVRPAITARNVVMEHLYRQPPIRLDALMEELAEQARLVRPYAGDTTDLLHAALSGGKRILLEGQLGALRDPDHGIYPFSTSSSPLAGFASVGAGIPARCIERVVSVTKAYSTCVGAGPMLTELSGDAASELRSRGGDMGEYGATTGRPRRVGWFDAVATRYGCLLQGASELAVTCLDVLSYLDRIPVCIAYEMNGQRSMRFPTTPELSQVRCVYREMPGWETDLRQIRTFADLPAAARDYIALIEELCEVPVRWISVGPGREQLARR